MDKNVKSVVDLIIDTMASSIFFATTWDMHARPKVLRIRVWDFKDKLEAVSNGLNDKELQSACQTFSTVCQQAEITENFDYTESDVLVDAFIVLLTVFENSVHTKEIEPSNAQEILFSAYFINIFKNTLKKLADDLEKEKAQTSVV